MVTPDGPVLEQEQPAAKVAARFGVSERTVRKWLARWRAGGEPALNDRSPAPARPAPAAVRPHRPDRGAPARQARGIINRDVQVLAADTAAR
jgi:transposase-like protein